MMIQSVAPASAAAIAPGAWPACAAGRVRMISLAIVRETAPPASTAPSSSASAKATRPVRMGRALIPTAVPMDFATSLAPRPMPRQTAMIVPAAIAAGSGPISPTSAPAATTARDATASSPAMRSDGLAMRLASSAWPMRSRSPSRTRYLRLVLIGLVMRGTIEVRASGTRAIETRLA